MKKPQKNIEAYLNNDFNIEIFEDLTDNEEYKALFKPLDFLNFLYQEFDFFQENAGNYFLIRKHFEQIDFKGKNRYYFFWALNHLIDEAFPSSNNLGEVVARSCEYIESLYLLIEDEVYPDAKNDEVKKVYDFDNVKKYIETLPNVKDKIKYLVEIKTDYLQNNHGGLMDVPMWNETTFDKKCELEIKKLNEILRLEITQHKPKNSKFENDGIANSLKLKDTIVSKIDFIRVINAMQELRAFETPNGTLATKKDVMQAFGNIVGINLSNYDKDLNKAFTSNVSIEANLEIFEKMKSKTQEIFLNKQNKPKK